MVSEGRWVDSDVWLVLGAIGRHVSEFDSPMGLEGGQSGSTIPLRS